MPMRFGEMVLVIRTQDYASRNLNRLSQNLGKLSKTQQLQRRLQTQGIQADRLAQRQNTLGRDIGMLRQRVGIEQNLLDIQSRRRQEARRLGNLERAADPATGQIRGAAGRFVGSAAPAIAAASAEVNRLTTAEAALKRQHTALLDNIRLTRPALASMNSARAAAELSRLEKQLDLTSRQLRVVQTDIGITQKAINQLKWDNVHRFGQGMSRLGRVMQLTGLIATGSFIVAGNAAADFGQSVTLAATQARDLNAPFTQTAKRSKELGNVILQMMQRFPASADEMSNAAYEIFSSLDLAEKGVFNFSRGVQILRLVNQAGVAGMTSLDDSTRGIVITLNNFAKAGKDGIITTRSVNRILDQMFSIIRFGDIHMNELAKMMETLAPAAKNAGHELEDIAPAIATLTRLIGPGRTAAGLALLETALANRDFTAGLSDMGVEIRKSEGGLIPFVDIMEKLVALEPGLAKGTVTAEEFFKLITAQGRLVRTGRVTEGQQFPIQARRAFQAAAKNLDMLRESQDNIISNKQEFDSALKAMMQTPAVQWKIFLNSLKAVALEIGQDALPALLSIAGGIKSLITWYRNLDPELKKNIIRITLWVSVAALIGGIALSVVGGLISMVAAVALLTGGLGTTGGTGLIGRMVMLLALLKRLTLIGAILITVKIIVDSKQLENLRGWIEKNVPGGNKLVDILGFSGKDFKNLVTGADEADKAIKNFNPAERMFPGTKDMRTWGDMFPKLAKEYKENGKEALTWQQISKNSRKEVEKWAANNLATKSLDDLRKQFRGAGEDATGMAESVRAASEQAAQQIDQAAQRMSQIWEQFRQENTQAFGDLFSGPFFQSETWSLAEEWDVKPTMREINRDLKEQIQAFRKWRSTLATISKRKGATPELMKELHALGPGAMKFLEVLRSGAPGAWNQFIGLWRTKQNEITKATQIDFDKQLKQWFKYGSNIAKQIILGLRSENVELDNAFKKYITNKFPGIVAQAEQQAIAEWKKNHPQTGATGGTGGGQSGGGNNSSKTNSDNTTIIVYPREGETTVEALKRAAWEAANGGRRRGTVRGGD